ncbi:MFS general substrate transporter [Panus rudis PR-1116 ss-1]|nr:MFS general substrate transporter [Panus rudis PR-1116 ss-1]
MSTVSSETASVRPGTEAADVEKDAAAQNEKQNETNDANESPYLVTLTQEDDPKQLSTLHKWLAVLVISTSALCVTCASSVAGFTEGAISQEFHVGKEVSILGISLFVQGLGFGPLLVGPLSELYGRNIVYRVSFGLFWVFSWPVAFGHHIAVFLIFRFLTGFCGAAFLSVAGGSVSDLFANDKVATPMAVFTISPFIGPVVGPLISGFINQNTYWRWTYRVMIIWISVELVGLLLFVPETYTPVITKWKAQKLRKTTGNPEFYAPIEKQSKSLLRSIKMSCYTPFKLLLLDRMALLLDVWNALLLGILYLTFQAFPVIFMEVHGFSMQATGLTFLGLGVGMLVALATQPLWNRFARNEAHKYGGNPPPEVRLVMGQVGAVLVPLSLYWLAFTTYQQVHWIVPIIASVPFGAGVLFCFISTFTYLVIAYRPVAASAMAANTFVRTCFAAAFPLFAGQMYHTLGTVGATALLAGLTTLAAPLPFVFHRIGARLRAKSRFTHA